MAELLSFILIAYGFLLGIFISYAIASNFNTNKSEVEEISTAMEMLGDKDLKSKKINFLKMNKLTLFLYLAYSLSSALYFLGTTWLVLLSISLIIVELIDYVRNQREIKAIEQFEKLFETDKLSIVVMVWHLIVIAIQIGAML